MDYNFKKANDKKTIILFKENKYIGLQELINTIDLYNITLEDIVLKIELVKDNSSAKEVIGSERALVEILDEVVEISDLFEGIIDDEDLFPSIQIPIDKFKEIILDTICAKISNDNLHEKIEDIIHKWDPLEVFPFAPKDEYENEINKITKLVNDFQSTEELAVAIEKIFFDSFGAEIINVPKEVYISLADNIFKK